MLDHMLFDHFKWIKDYVGKQITVPSNISLYKLSQNGNGGVLYSTLTHVYHAFIQVKRGVETC